MKTFGALLAIFMITTALRADTAESLTEGMLRLGPKMAEVTPVLDKLMERNAPDERFPHYTVWTLYGQNDTSVYLTHDSTGHIYEAFFQFYLGHDKRREEHYNQCLPIARFLIHTFMKKQRPSINEIDAGLREIEHTRAIKTFREPDRVVYFRYKMASSLPEIEDGYRCFRIEIGGPEKAPSEDR